ncbi:Arabinose operon regulatory protein [Calycomorphotria hydatis]|uniref:Arabinose operon regulatory protein n=2 Tax=Calycomorphotria hydatis TaxID=2528027 RepID=A0A517T9R5_9PLAN|nr:Arabinose operon regulatory protein [Calycomorphotria hydatis]
MREAYEKLVPPDGQSFRCFNRKSLKTTVKLHSHPEYELTYVEKGSGTRIVGDSIDTYRDNDLVLVGPHLPHLWQSDEFLGKRYDQHPAIVMQFTGDFLGERFFDLPEMKRIKDMLSAASRGLWFDITSSKTLVNMINQMPAESPELRIIHVLECLRELSLVESPRVLSSPVRSKAEHSKRAQRLEKVCSYISQNFQDSSLTHAQIADYAHMNPSAFSRFFRESTGKTSSQYISELRIGLACRLLIDTEMTVLGISESAGFNNLSNFNRRFRELKQMSPREFREKYAAGYDMFV